MVKLHYTHHTGANKQYFEKVLYKLAKDRKIELRVTGIGEYLHEGNQDEDVLCYQTFPDEFQPAKHNPNLVQQTDKLFQVFPGHKILVDAHDNGEVDSFSRFADSQELPRVKCFPSQRFESQFNVILLSTISIKDPDTIGDNFERTVKISCKFGVREYNHTVRDSVVMQLNKFFPGQADHSWLDGRAAYEEDMRRTLIAIGAPGWGQYSATHQLALRTGALLFAYDSFNDLQYLPHVLLKDGVNFISYNLFNFRHKLQWLLDNPETVERVRKNGRNAFKRGYNIKKSADLFYDYLKKVIK